MSGRKSKIILAVMLALTYPTAAACTGTYTWLTCTVVSTPF
ncbi:hypothetical protein MAHJHV50_50550 [Mycobacterium avium subsp. hominissuis]